MCLKSGHSDGNVLGVGDIQNYIQQIIVKNYHNIIAKLYSASQKVLEQNLRALTVSRRYHL